MGRQTYRDTLTGPKRAPTLEWSEAAQYGLAKVGARPSHSPRPPSPLGAGADAEQPTLESLGVANSGHFPLLFFKEARYLASRGGPAGAGLSASASAPLLSIVRAATAASTLGVPKRSVQLSTADSARALSAAERRGSMPPGTSRRTHRTARPSLGDGEAAEAAGPAGAGEDGSSPAGSPSGRGGAGAQLAQRFVELEKKIAAAAKKEARKKQQQGRRLQVARRRESTSNVPQGSGEAPAVPALTSSLLGTLGPAADRPGTHDKAPSVSTARSAISQGGGGLGGGVLAPIPAELRTLLLPKRLLAATSTTPSQRAALNAADYAAAIPKRKLALTRALWKEYWRATGEAQATGPARRVRAILRDAGVLGPAPPASATHPLPSSRSSAALQLPPPGTGTGSGAGSAPTAALLGPSSAPAPGTAPSSSAPASRSSFLKRSKNASGLGASRALSAARAALEGIVGGLTEAGLALLRPTTPTPRSVPRAVDIDPGSGWQAYCEACAALETRALAAVEEAARAPSLSLPRRALLARGAAALALFLQQNRYVTRLDLRDNGIESSAAVALGTALAANQTVTYLDLSGNRPGLAGCAAICAALASNEGELHTLRLANCALGDREAAVAALALEQNYTLTRLDLSYNGVGDRGALSLARALILNEVVTSLDLSWNRLRSKAGVALGTALTKNEVLTDLRLASNGLGGSGLSTIARALSTNAATALRVLDLTQTGMDDDAAAALAAGLKANRTLERLCVGRNGELSDEGARPLVEALAGHAGLRSWACRASSCAPRPPPPRRAPDAGRQLAFGPPDPEEDPRLLSVAAVPNALAAPEPLPRATEGMRAWELEAVQRMRARPMPVTPAAAAPPGPESKPKSA
eukprot:tig00020556_g11008.t1